MGGSPSFSQPRQPTGQSVHIPTATPRVRRTQLIPRVPPPPARVMPTATTEPGSSRGAGAAAGAGYANRNNQTLNHPGLRRCRRRGLCQPNNQGLAYPGAAGAAAGAGYANNHSGINGAWNGNNYGGWGATGYGMGYGTGYGGVGAWGVGSPMYGWGYSGYSNPYSGGDSGRVAFRQTVVAQQPSGANQQGIQLLPADQHDRRAARAGRRRPGECGVRPGPRRVQGGRLRQGPAARPAGLSQTPNDRTLHEFLALVYFAQGKYDQAAEPLYAVLSVAPGWDWTTLSGMYPDVDTYTGQLRALEASVRANPDSAHARFVLAYQYLGQGHVENAVAQLKEVVKLQPATRSRRSSSRITSPRAPPSLRPPSRPPPPRRPSRETGRDLDGHAGQGREDRPGDPGRRQVQLGRFGPG